MQPGLFATILLLGHDEVLLKCRTAILRGAGYRAQAALGIESFNDQFLAALELIVFCHTMSLCEIEQVIAQSGRVNSKLKFLLLRTYAQPARVSGMNQFSSLPEPEALLDGVKLALGIKDYPPLSPASPSARRGAKL